MFREILDKALGRDSTKADVAQMIVLIDYKPQFCDYANFTKYDPEYWFNLAEDVSDNSDAPELSLGLWAIAASQFFFDGPHRSMERAKAALMRGMSLRKEHPVLMTIGKAVMMTDMGMIEDAPARTTVETEGLASAIRRIESFETLVKEDLS
jgi:hypothetical protein